MAINPQPPAGGLNQATAQAQPPAPKENLAARAAGMEQEQAEAPQDYFTKTLEDLRKQRESLNSQIASLKSSLDYRKGLPFDPVMMSAAAGFLKPTKTGSFGESLGYASEMMSNEAEKEYARKQAAAKLGLELDEKALALQTKGLEMEDLLRMSGLGGMGAKPAAGAQVAAAPTGTATDAGAPTGAPAPAGTLATAPATGRVGQTGAPNQMRLISDSDITRAYAISKEYGDKIANIAKIQREDIISTPEGLFSRSQQRYLETEPFQTKIVERDFGRFIGPKKVPEKLSREYDKIRAEAVEKNDPDIEFNWFKRQGWLEGPIKPTKEEVAAGKGKPETKEGEEPLSLEERETRKKIRETRETEEAKQEQTQINDMRVNAKNSREMGNIARDMTAYATSNPRAFQLLQNTTIRDAIFRAAEKGITTPGGSIAFPARELESYKLKPEDREALQMFMQAYARQTVAFRKVARAPGEGATTESEGLLFSQLGALPSDTARVIILKSEALELKAEYDRQLFRTWNDYRKKNPDAGYADFLTSKERDTLDNAYDKRLEAMRERNKDILGNVPAPKTKPKAETPAKPAEPSAKAAEPVRTKEPAAGAKQPPRITGNDDPVYKNLKPGELYIAPDGTVKTKR